MAAGARFIISPGLDLATVAYCRQAQVAVLPLSKKLAEPAHALETELRRRFNVFYDDAGNIGRRYRRQDEIGTPWGITVDGQTMEDDTVTL